MNRRDNDYNERNRGGNRDMGQGRESMYRGAYRFDDHRTTRNQLGDEHDHRRDDRGHADQRNTYGHSNNYGSMGSYGGAQGYGSSRGGHGHPGQERSGFDATSGHGRHDPNRPDEDRQVYGAYWDRNSFNENDNDRFSREHRSQHLERNRYNHYDRGGNDDSRYEIYDTSQRQYNSGQYNNSAGGFPSYDFNRDMDDAPHEQERYGSRQRPMRRQGSGNDQDQHYGTRYNEGNMAGSLSWGYDGYRGNMDADRDRRYDPMSGQAHRNRHQENERDERQGFRSRGGYGANNSSPDERDHNR